MKLQVPRDSNQQVSYILKKNSFNMENDVIFKLQQKIYEYSFFDVPTSEETSGEVTTLLVTPQRSLTSD